MKKKPVKMGLKFHLVDSLQPTKARRKSSNDHIFLVVEMGHCQKWEVRFGKDHQYTRGKLSSLICTGTGEASLQQYFLFSLTYILSNCNCLATIVLDKSASKDLQKFLKLLLVWASMLASQYKWKSSR